MSAFSKVLGIVCVIGVAGAFFNDVDQQKRPASQTVSVKQNDQKLDEEPRVDLSRPAYTKSGAIVCPLGILFDRREGYGIKAANRASATIFGRSEAIEKVGCQEWKGGQLLYISQPDDGAAWQSASPYADSPAELLVMTYHLSNSSNEGRK